MSSFRVVLSFSLALVLSASPAFATTTGHSTGSSRVHGSSHHSSSHARTKGKKVAKSHKLHGQQSIDAQRVTAIQQALIREHYLSGDASGQWDSSTQAAMQKYQSDQGWQTRLMPDSRALKKLGLGPDYSTAINARDVAQGSTAPASTIPTGQAAGFAAAAGVNQ